MHATPVAARSARESIHDSTSAADVPLRQLPLDALHRAYGARMAPFAGYAMPVQYAGVLAEHVQCRSRAALFDVSHMGQATLRGAQAATALERLVPGDMTGLRPGRQRYSMFLIDDGGVLDDIMVANHGADRLVLVCNASRKADDFAHIAAELPETRLEIHDDRALLALQGPQAADVMARLSPGAAALRFMQVARLDVAGLACWVSRSGYTGEDGFEVSVADADAEALAETLLAAPEVELAGLGARDCLRLEAGLCLYGSDLDTTTTPIEAGLAFVIAQRRRTDWRFPGGPSLRTQLAEGPSRRRVGLVLDDRAPARAGAPICDAEGNEVGTVTSGTFSPTLGRPIAMGYVAIAHAAIGTRLSVTVRGKPLAAGVAPLPFVPHRYQR